MFLREQMPVCVVQLVTVTSLSAGDVQGPGPYHDAGEQAHAFPAVGVWHHVSVANGEEGDGDKPHGPQEVAGHFLFIVVPRESREGWSARTGPSSFITPPGAVLESGSQSPRGLTVIKAWLRGVVLPGQRAPKSSSQAPFHPPSFTDPKAAARDICPSSPGHGAERGPGEVCPHVSTHVHRNLSHRQTDRQARTRVAMGTRSGTEVRSHIRHREELPSPARP